jgi:hypothetical protein
MSSVMQTFSNEKSHEGSRTDPLASARRLAQCFPDTSTFARRRRCRIASRAPRASARDLAGCCASTRLARGAPRQGSRRRVKARFRPIRLCEKILGQSGPCSNLLERRYRANARLRPSAPYLASPRKGARKIYAKRVGEPGRNHGARTRIPAVMRRARPAACNDGRPDADGRREWRRKASTRPIERRNPRPSPCDYVNHGGARSDRLVPAAVDATHDTELKNHPRPQPRREERGDAPELDAAIPRSRRSSRPLFRPGPIAVDDKGGKAPAASGDGSLGIGSLKATAPSPGQS